MKSGALDVSRQALAAATGFDNHPAHGGGQVVTTDMSWIEPEVSLSGALLERFIVPPFSILDTRQGYWQERRRWWLGLGLQSELGRGDISGVTRYRIAGQTSTANPSSQVRLADPRYGPARAFSTDMMKGEHVGSDITAAGTSIFDPVLCELAYRWFCPPGGVVLDPFAGGSVRGIVAAYLGHPYLGVDLSARQVEANREQAARILTTQPIPEWIVGDSGAVLPGVTRSADLVFTCPPYYDLEVYSDDARDLSALRSYADFLVAYRAIIAAAVDRLRPGRFACIVVSEIRGKEGTFQGLVPDTIAAFIHAGMRYYNEAILINSAGSLPIRITKQFEAGRKLGRTHQNVLVFLKGDQPRGWSYDREAPPDPQTTMFGDDA